jgi:hypothetical protein
MSFFDSKEEVINIELTSYGKLLLSKGLFKPSFYSFHDEDIIYDLNYVSGSELASKAEIRIQESAITLKPIYNTSSPIPSLGIELDQTNLQKSFANFDADKKILKEDDSLGNSSISNNYIPAWKIDNLASNFTSVSKTFTDRNLNIPQLNCILTSSFFSVTQQELEDDEELSSLLNFENSYSTNDGQTSIYLTEEVLLKIQELNTDLDYDHFDLQVFKVNTDLQNNETYIPLKFIGQQSEVDENNFLISDTPFLVGDIDDTYVENYFNISLDNEIQNNKACKYILKTTADQDQIFKDIGVCDSTDNRVETDRLYQIINDRATGRNC